MKAIFLGAGASYDCGMPLVWELTAEIKRFFIKSNLENLNNGWRLQGGGWGSNTIAEVKRLLETKEMHYENIIGNVEVLFSRERNAERMQELAGVHAFLLQTVYGLLLERQVKNMYYALGVLDDDYGGFRKIAEQNRPLWVFSVNHDLIVELLASKLWIPIKCGFGDRATLSMRSEPNGESAEVSFDLLTRESIKTNNYDFLKQGELGINLIKLHGALDIFGYKDELNYLKILSRDNRPESYVHQMWLIDRINQNVATKHMGRTIRGYAINEHSYFDEAGKMQYLRNSILSGAHKFSNKISQIVPSEFLGIFGSYLNWCNELICIGYSFGDSHVDTVLKNWLSASHDRRLTIINPGIDCCPGSLGHLYNQVTCISQGASDYFLNVEGDEVSTPGKQEEQPARKPANGLPPS